MRALLALAAVACLVLVIGFVALSRYAPLEQGSLFSGRSSVEYRPDATFVIRQAVRNSGRVSVQLTGLGRSSSSGPVRMSVVGALPRLGRGDEAEVTLRVRLASDSCTRMAANSLLTVSQIPITYRVLGRNRTQWVALGSPIEVRFVDPLVPASGCRRSTD
jgi:hypothetical protein